jgi:hypothetical protein
MSVSIRDVNASVLWAAPSHVWQYQIRSRVSEVERTTYKVHICKLSEPSKDIEEDIGYATTLSCGGMSGSDICAQRE